MTIRTDLDYFIEYATKVRDSFVQDRRAKIRDSYELDRYSKLPRSETREEADRRFLRIEGSSDLKSPQSIFNRAIFDLIQTIIREDNRAFTHHSGIEGIIVRCAPRQPVTLKNLVEVVRRFFTEQVCRPKPFDPPYPIESIKKYDAIVIGLQISNLATISIGQLVVMAADVVETAGTVGLSPPNRQPTPLLYKCSALMTERETCKQIDAMLSKDLDEEDFEQFAGESNVDDLVADLADAILDSLLGELVLELNSIDAKKSGKAKQVALQHVNGHTGKVAQ